MKDILNLIVTNLVEKPELVEITEIALEDGAIKYTVKVDESDIGRVIGKSGKIAKAIRTVTRAVAMQNGKKIVIEFDA